MEILLASNNAKKRAELERLLAPLGHTLLVPADVGGVPDVDEDRPTFAGNAAKKALSARITGRLVLADDSGLEVDHLDGAPGVLSARFAGTHGDAAANNALLLERLEGVPEARRGARFVCALALAGTAGGGGEPRILLEVEGQTRGRILSAPRGEGGFGYDPLFLFTEEGQPWTGTCFAELSSEAKGSVSHRGRALRELARRLPALLDRPLN